MIIWSSVILTRHHDRYNFCHRYTQLELDIAATILVALGYRKGVQISRMVYSVAKTGAYLIYYTIVDIIVGGVGVQKITSP